MVFSEGERCVRCLVGDKIDRVPFGVGLGWCPWELTLERWRKETGIADLNVAELLGFDKSFIIPELYQGIYPEFELKIIEKNEEFIISRDERGIIRRERSDRGSIPEFLDYPVKNAQDWDELKVERLRMAEPSRIFQDWDIFKARLAKTGESVQVGCYPFGIFGMARDLLGVESLLIGFLDQPELIHDIMNHLVHLWISIWERVSAQVQIDHIHIWEDMSGKQGSLISPKMVEEFMMPCYDKIADFARSVGVRIISVDTDGDCSELVPIMMKHGINMFFPFEVQAGNDILEYRKRYPGLGIVGGLDKRALAGTKADIDVEIDKAAKMCQLGRYVPGFDHLIPPDVSWDNFQYAAKRLKDVCYNA